jgi:hypothetical protein
MKKTILLGAHMSIAGGAHMAIERACSIQCTSYCHVERSRDISNFSPKYSTVGFLNGKRFLDFASLRSK